MARSKHLSARRSMMRKWRYYRRLRNKRRTKANLLPLKEMLTREMLHWRTSNCMKGSKSLVGWRVTSCLVVRSRELPSQEPWSDSPRSCCWMRQPQLLTKTLRRRCKVLWRTPCREEPRSSLLIEWVLSKSATRSSCSRAARSLRREDSMSSRTRMVGSSPILLKESNNEQIESFR